MSNLKEVSKKDWNGGGTLEHINAGSLQRIADACELMATNFLALQRKNKELEESRQWWIDRANDREKTISSMKGQITKLTNKIARLNQSNDPL